MKKYSLILLLSIISLGNMIAQQNVFKTQGIPRPELGVSSKAGLPKTKELKSTGTEIPDFSFDQIKFWVGTGENKAALIIDWYFDNSPTLVWGFRWDGKASGEEMLRAIAAEDPRFAASIEGWGWANTLSGLGYDANDDNNGTFCVTNGSTQLCIEDNGVMEATGDGYSPVDTTDYWRSGWYDGYWSYQLGEPGASDWEYSNVGFTDRTLSDGCWDGWAYQIGWDSYEGVIPRLPYVSVAPMTLDCTTTTLDAEDILQLTPTVYQKSYAGQTVTWTSSNTQVATVDQTGKVTAVKGGNTTVTAKIADNCYAVCDITVNLQAEGGFTYDDVKFWIGEGAKKNIMAIEWHDGKTPDALVWGYKWDGDKTAFEMLQDIFEADHRLFALVRKSSSTDDERSLIGFGYDINGENQPALLQGGNTVYPLYAVKGLITTTITDASISTLDTFTAIDNDDHWQSGWNNSHWSFWVKGSSSSDFTYTDTKLTGHLLEDGSWVGWSFNENPGQADATPLSDGLTAVSTYVKETIDYTKGIFFVNEDWFGHTNGSLNFLTEEGKMVYRAYTRENYGQAFGCTTQFGAIYGDNFYFVSKQAADGGDTQYTPGGRLVVADAKTLTKKAAFDNIGGGDGRAFLGVDEKTGYIGTSSGIQILNLENLTLGGKVQGADNSGGLYAGQVGTMLRIGDYVFAAAQSKGVLVIDANEHKVLTTIECKNIGTIVQSKDGYLWATAYKDGLWKIDPYRLEVVEKREIPANALIPGSWGAWSSSLICASDKTNTLYWAKMNGSSMTFFGTKVYKYDIDNPNLDQPLYELQGKEAFYGSAINIDPITDNLIITSTQTGYGENYSYNWIHVVDPETGGMVKKYTLDKYYWFPAVSVFPDNYAPVISDNLSDLSINAKATYSLLENVTDEDNRDAAIISTVSGGEDIVRPAIENGEIVLQPLKAGTATVTLKSNSNGKIASKNMNINVTFIPVESISLNKTTLALDARDTVTLIPAILPVTASNKTVIWSSSNENVATVDENGFITTYNVSAETNVIITATAEDGGKQAQCAITVKNVPVRGVTLGATEKALKAGGTLQLTPVFSPENATNQNVTWISSNEDVATVDEDGLVKGIAEGETTITATTEEGSYRTECNISVYTAVTSVKLNVTTLRIDKGRTYQLVATVSPTDATNKNVTWSSSNEDVATVDNNGLITTKSYGSASIVVTTVDEGKTRTCNLTVLKPVTSISINPSEAKLGTGHTLQLNVIYEPEDATNKTVTWSTSSSATAAVSNGKVTAKQEGTVTITATTSTAAIETGSTQPKATATISIGTPVTGINLDDTSKAVIGTGGSLTVTAEITPTDAINKNIIWTSSDENVAIVEKDGLRSQSVTAGSVKVIPVGDGTTTITATSEDGSYTSSREVTVTSITGMEFSSLQRTISYNGGKLMLNNYDGYTFHVYTLSGSPIMQFNVDSDKFVSEISLPDGIYVLNGQNGDKATTIKLSIK